MAQCNQLDWISSHYAVTLWNWRRSYLVSSSEISIWICVHSTYTLHVGVTASQHFIHRLKLRWNWPTWPEMRFPVFHVILCFDGVFTFQRITIAFCNLSTKIEMMWLYVYLYEIMFQFFSQELDESTWIVVDVLSWPNEWMYDEILW